MKGKGILKIKVLVKKSWDITQKKKTKKISVNY
jgi:hypothetical protein